MYGWLFVVVVTYHGVDGLGDREGARAEEEREEQRTRPSNKQRRSLVELDPKQYRHLGPSDPRTNNSAADRATNTATIVSRVASFLR